MVFGTGIDIVDVTRFERFVRDNNQALLDRLFTSREQQYCAARKHSAQHFALRFAAKEAFLKAIGTGLRDGLCWKDMEVVNDVLGKPDLVLTGRAAEIFEEHGLSRCFLSVSHDGNFAVAMVVLERP